VRDMASAVAAFLPDTEVVYAGQGDPDNRDYNVSFAKLAALGDRPLVRWSLEAGVAELVGALHARGLSAEEFHGAPALRLKQLTDLMSAGRLDDDLRWRP